MVSEFRNAHIYDAHIYDLESSKRYKVCVTSAFCQHLDDPLNQNEREDQRDREKNKTEKNEKEGNGRPVISVEIMQVQIRVPGMG
jgi:hypothetical protein